MNTDEHDDLWCLLGQARTKVPSPFFSRNVLRTIREERTEKTGVFAWMRRHWQIGSLSTCAVIAAAFVVFTPDPERADQSTTVLAESVAQSIDYQVINNLDELIAAEENLAWLDN
ncbi:MAG: hypothetical protein K8R23_17530 [Chthoniobacter sp.]|nr:hypothetical protein [Chthoniobacter sp.]